MHPALRPYFQHVWPLFWPWLVWNLLRFARWYERTGIEALLAVDRFGNIRITCVADVPLPDDLYTYDAPDVLPWERLAPGFALPEGGFAGLAVYRVFIVCISCAPAPLAEFSPHVRGPPLVAPRSPPTPAEAGVHRPAISSCTIGEICPWTPAFAGVCGK